MPRAASSSAHRFMQSSPFLISGYRNSQAGWKLKRRTVKNPIQSANSDHHHYLDYFPSQEFAADRTPPWGRGWIFAPSKKEMLQCGEALRVKLGTRSERAGK